MFRKPFREWMVKLGLARIKAMAKTCDKSFAPGEITTKSSFRPTIKRIVRPGMINMASSKTSLPLIKNSAKIKQ
jgi:hypothetical protein